MPGNVTASEGKQKSLKINDWTMGIVSQKSATNVDHYDTTPPNAYGFGLVPNNGQKVSSSPNTYGCMALQNGGLLLGPTVFNSNMPSITLPEGVENPVITGIINSQIPGEEGDTWKYIIVNNLGESGTITTMVFAIKNGNVSSIGGPIATQTGLTSESATPNALSFPFITTVMAPDNTYVVGIFWTAISQSIVYYVPYLVEPVGVMAGVAPLPHYAIPANGRIWGIVYGTSSLQPDLLNAIAYNEPTQPETTGGNIEWIDQIATIIDFDDPGSIAAFGMITNDEMLLIKIGEGAVLISGDIYNPTVVKLPSVRGTNGLMGSATLTPVGLVYRSRGNGAWIWNGGSTSQKISPQIDDAMWPDQWNLGSTPARDAVYPSEIPLTGVLTYNSPFVFNAQYCQNKIFFDGGLFFDLDTQSWWRLPPYTGITYDVKPPFVPYFYTINHNNYDGANSLPCPISAVWFGGPETGTDPTDLIFTNYAFDVSGGDYEGFVPDGFYGSYWESNPIQLATEGIVEIQEISVVVQGTGQLSISIAGVDGEVLDFQNQLVSSTGFTRVRFIAGMETNSLIIRLGWTNATGGGVGLTGYATPIVESIQVDYVDRFPVKVAV